METLIGFAVGYWIGTRHGRKGLEDAVDTVRELWASPAGQRLFREGTSALQGVLPVADAVRKNRRSTRSALISSVVDEILERRSARQAAA
jgi:hypothetical protein